MFRNFSEIAKVKCEKTRVALVVCSDEEALKSLCLGFPQCFSDKRICDPVPLSLLQQRVSELRPLRGWRTATTLACTECNIPLMFSFTGDKVPQSLKEQLYGQRFGAMFVPVILDGVWCLTVYMGTNESEDRIYNEKTVARGVPISLIAKDSVDLNS